MWLNALKLIKKVQHRIKADPVKSTAVGSRKCVKLTLAKRYVRPDGNALWVRNSFYLLRDQSQLPSHIILICNYVTELRRAERLLINNEKFAVVGQLASSIAHEINNHLEAVLYLFYLVREADTLEKARNYAAQAEEEVQRGLKIATQTPKLHKQQTNPTSTRMVELLESVLALFKGKLLTSNVQVQLEPADDPRLTCYPGEIRQGLANLVRNL